MSEPNFVAAHSVHFEMSYRTCKSLWSTGGTSNFMDHVLYIAKTFEDVFWTVILSCHLMLGMPNPLLVLIVSHLHFHLFELHIHSWPELSHLLLHSNQLPLPRAHISAKLGDAGITPEIIGGEAERDHWMRIVGWKERCEDREIEKMVGENRK